MKKWENKEQKSYFILLNRFRGRKRASVRTSSGGHLYLTYFSLMGTLTDRLLRTSTWEFLRLSFCKSNDSTFIDDNQFADDTRPSKGISSILGDRIQDNCSVNNCSVKQTGVVKGGSTKRLFSLILYVEGIKVKDKKIEVGQKKTGENELKEYVLLVSFSFFCPPLFSLSGTQERLGFLRRKSVDWFREFYGRGTPRSPSRRHEPFEVSNRELGPENLPY